MSSVKGNQGELTPSVLLILMLLYSISLLLLSCVESFTADSNVCLSNYPSMCSGSDCCSVYSFYVLLDECKCNVFMCFNVANISRGMQFVSFV